MSDAPSLPATAVAPTELALPLVVSTRSARRRRAIGLVLVWAILLGNAGVIVWLWVDGGNLTDKTTGDLFTSIARITGLLCAYLALIQVLLLARIPALERLVGFDRLTIWHRWNGFATVDLLVLHVLFCVWGYSLMDRISIGSELSTMLDGGIYPGMITATIGTMFLIAVAATSIVIMRRRLPYEWWYAVHLLAYAGIALGWFHQIPTGNELVLDRLAADYWRALYLATILLLVGFRLLAPAVQAIRHRLRVGEVVEEIPGVVSLHITGRRLDRLRAVPGQFFLWRFLARGHWRTAGRSPSPLRPTVGRSASPSRPSATTARSSRLCRSGRACLPKARSASSPTGRGAARRLCSSPAESASLPSGR